MLSVKSIALLLFLSNTLVIRVDALENQMAEHKKAVFIIGPGRCGSSCLAGTLKILGLNLGTHLLGPNKKNEKGHFEDTRTVKLNHAIIHELKATRSKLINWENEKNIEQLITRIEMHLQESFNGCAIFGVKNPDLTMLLPLYIRAAQNLGYTPKIIMALRNPREIVASFERGCSQKRNYALFVVANFLTVMIRDAQGYDTIAIDFSDLLNKTEQTIDKLRKFLPELQPYQAVKEQVDAFLDKGLKHY